MLQTIIGGKEWLCNVAVSLKAIAVQTAISNNGLDTRQKYDVEFLT